MFVIKRNSVIITALVLMIGFAGYLNYVDGKKANNDNVANIEENSNTDQLYILDETTGQEVAVIKNGSGDEITGNALVNSEIGIALTEQEGSGSTSTNESTGTNESTEREPGTAVFVNSTNDSSFFVEAKLEREQARSKDRETLMQLINSTNLEKDQRAKFADQVQTIRQRTEAETTTEAMIEAKGFTEAYVCIGDAGVEVIVSKKVLSDAELVQIEDIVKRQTGFSVENIKISPLKG